MDEINLLLNDQDDEQQLLVDDIRSIETEGILDKSRQLGPLLGAEKIDTYSASAKLESCLTLRRCNKDYGNAGGCKFGGEQLAEFDRCTTKGCISPLRRFHNAVGHFVEGNLLKVSDKYVTICLQPEILDSIEDFTQSLNIELGSSIRRGLLWALQNCSQCYTVDTGIWMYKGEKLPSHIASSMDLVSVSFPPPLSAHTQHAWLESSDTKDSTKLLNVFRQPQETTSVTGVLGTLHNCQVIDLAQEEPDAPIDSVAREEDLDKYEGFLCKGHTAHSLEAGRVRRVCSDVSVRILSKNLLDRLYKGLEVSAKYNRGPKEWLLYCMGKMVKCTTKFLTMLRNFLVSSSSTNIHSATLHINSDMHSAILSITGGVIVRRDVNNLIVDSTSIYCSPWPDDRYIPEYPDILADGGFRFYFSAYFLTIPHIAWDRPPRPLIASVQHVQAVAVPYGAGTSSVAPTHISRPLVSTEFLESIISDETAGIADNMPGEDLVICFANFNNTYEDSIILSEGSANRGLFNHMAFSANVINTNETIPEVGNKAHIQTNKWWKMYANNYTNSTDFRAKKNGIAATTAAVDGRGKVISTSLTTSGQTSVKVLRFAEPVTGDKFATGHGQKGVIKVLREVDMPYGIDENGQPIKFDMIMSLSSVSNRLTEGQYYEMVSGAKAAKEGKRIIVKPYEYHDNHLETVLYDGITGNLILRTDEDNTVGLEEWNGDIPILASWGICRVWQMTQLTWDKQHYTHNTAGKYSITTGTGRTAGGGIRHGEMESHAAASSGLLRCHEELRSRMDLLNVHICTKCEHLAQICSCGDESTLTLTSIPHSMMVFDYANLHTAGYVTKYKVSF